MAASQGKKQASHGVLDRLQCRQRKRNLRYGDTGKICGGDVYRPGERGEELLERLLTMLAEEGEKATYEYIRREVLKNKK